MIASRTLDDCKRLQLQAHLSLDTQPPFRLTSHSGLNFVRCKDEHVIGWNPLWWWGSRWNGRKGRSRRRVSESFGGVCKANRKLGLPGRASGNVGAVVEPSAEGSQ